MMLSSYLRDLFSGEAFSLKAEGSLRRLNGFGDVSI
jgi:hypothetical protein